jgi:hypothetical protein
VQLSLFVSKLLALSSVLVNGPEAEIEGRRRQLAEVTRSFDRPTLAYSFPVDIPLPALAVLELLALCQFRKNGLASDPKNTFRVGPVLNAIFSHNYL